MTTSKITASHPSGEVTGAPVRLHSLDAFRGFVILTMIFVNYLAGVSQIPAWAKHMPGTADGFTFVDLVFPGFLFMVGISIPLAMANRRRRGDSLLGLLGHIFIRSVSLLFLGVLLVNEGAYSEEAAGMSRSAWYLWALLAVVVIWSPRPKGASGTRARVFLILRVTAVLMLGYLLIRFRGKTGDETVWLRHSWWGILGLIGWAYLNCSLVYLVTKGSSTALMGALWFMLALYIGSRHGRLDWLEPVNRWVGVGSVLGSTSANVLAGVLVGNLFVGERAALTAGYRVRFLAVFATGLYLSGMLLRPLHGIVKNQATESYTLVAAGICCGVFLLFYWVIDIKQRRGWALGFTPAGQNPLLAYLLPDIVASLFAALGLEQVLWPYSSGGPGAVNALVLTLLILLVNAVLTKAGLRLKM